MGAVSGASGGAGAGGTPDLRVVGLKLIADGIDKALSELGKLGLVDDAGRSGTGRGFDDLEMDGMTIGGESVGAVFHSFCERWQWGVRALIDEGNAFAAGVGLAAGTLYQTDQTVKNSFKVGLNSLEGNPYASEQQVEQESWGRLTTPGWLHPDYSAKSFQDGLAASEQTLNGMGRDLATTEAAPGVELAPTLTGMDPDQYNAAVDATFGPQQEGQG